MHRYIFYLAIAAAAFAIGISAASIFFVKIKETSAIVQKNEEINAVKSPFQKQGNLNRKIHLPAIQSATPEKTTFTCNDPILNVVWSRIRKEKDFSEVAEEIADKKSTTAVKFSIKTSLV